MGHFPRLTSDQLDLTIDPVDFTQSLQDTLGNLGTPADGFDNAFNDLAAILSTAGDIGASLDDDLALFAAIISTIDPLSLLADLTSLPDSIATGMSILSDAGDLSSSIGPATPPPAPGSGGGGGGTGKVDCFNDSNCDAIVTFPRLAPASLPCTQLSQLTNNGSTPMHVTAVTIDQPASNPFTTDLKVGTIVPARSLISFHVTGVAGLPTGSYCGTIHIENDSNLPHLRWCVRMSVSDSGGACGPGGGPPPKPGAP